MTDKSCFECDHLNYIKQTSRGEESVCGLPGVPRNWNYRKMQYDDIADECNCYKKNSARV